MTFPAADTNPLVNMFPPATLPVAVTCPVVRKLPALILPAEFKLATAKDPDS